MAKKKKGGFVAPTGFPGGGNSSAPAPAPASAPAPAPSGPAVEKQRLVVGLDFGTTFTSVAFAHSTRSEDVQLVQSWPEQSADQVPTVLQYGDDRKIEWGYTVTPTNGDILKWFKILLHSSEPTSAVSVWQDTGLAMNNLNISDTPSKAAAGLSPNFFPPSVSPAQRTAEILHTLGIPPVAAVTEFLKNIRATTIAKMERTFGVEVVRSKRIEYVLTVPAMWSDSANALMVQAATSAGFGVHRINFELVSEPESAAAYTLKAVTANGLCQGDTFVVCDAGGGTVDLISYKIAQLDPLRLDESVGGFGDLCGSIFLDERFESYIRGVLGNQRFDAMKPKPREGMMKSWEQSVKFKFGNTAGRSFDVSVPTIPDDPEKNIEDNYHTMDYESVKKIFDPIVDRIVDMVAKQVREVQWKGGAVAAILLVGGFGSSVYLRERLEASFHKGKPIKVLQPINAQTAIARGALHRGLDGSIVKNRRSRRHYGSTASCLWLPGNGADFDRHRYFSFSEEVFMVPDGLHWYVKKDQVVGSTMSTSIGFYRTVPDMQNPPLTFDVELLSCVDDKPPEFKWRNPLAISRVCTLHADLTSVPVHLLQREMNSQGEEFLRISFDLKMTLLNEVLNFECWVDGRRCGSVTATFE